MYRCTQISHLDIELIPCKLKGLCMKKLLECHTSVSCNPSTIPPPSQGKLLLKPLGCNSINMHIQTSPLWGRAQEIADATFHFLTSAVLLWGSVQAHQSQSCNDATHSAVFPITCSALAPGKCHFFLFIMHMVSLFFYPSIGQHRMKKLQTKLCHAHCMGRLKLVLEEEYIDF